MQPYDSEVEDARQLLIKHKIGGPDEFRYSHSMHPLNGADVQPIRYTVTVKHGDKARSYEGGHGLSWLGDFEKDLMADLI